MKGYHIMKTYLPLIAMLISKTAFSSDLPLPGSPVSHNLEELFSPGTISCLLQKTPQIDTTKHQNINSNILLATLGTIDASTRTQSLSPAENASWKTLFFEGDDEDEGNDGFKLDLCAWYDLDETTSNDESTKSSSSSSSAAFATLNDFSKKGNNSELSETDSTDGSTNSASATHSSDGFSSKKQKL